MFRRFRRSLVRPLAGVVAAGLAVASAAAADLRVFDIEYSLLSDIPGMTQSLVTGDGVSRFTFRHQDIPGASSAYRWDAAKRQDGFGPQVGGRSHLHLPKGDFNVLLVTDSVPRGGEYGEAETIEALGKFIVALSHAAALTGRSPVGMPVDLKDCWGGKIRGVKHWSGQTYARPAPDTVRALQTVVARVIPAAL